MTFVRRRRRRRTPSSAEMNPAGPVRKDSCGVRRHGLAGNALPSGYGRCSFPSGRQGADGRGPTSRLRLSGPRMMAIPPIFGRRRPAVYRRFAQWSRVRGVARLHWASFWTRPAPEERWTGSGVLKVFGVRTARRAVRTESDDCGKSEPVHLARARDPATTSEPRKSCFGIHPAGPRHVTGADAFGATEAAGLRSHHGSVGPHGTCRPSSPTPARSATLTTRSSRQRRPPTARGAAKHGHVMDEARRDRHEHHRAQRTPSPEH